MRLPWTSCSVKSAGTFRPPFLQKRHEFDAHPCRRFQPSDESRRRLPLPPDSEQPPNLPLRHGHRVGFLYEGLYAHTLKKDSGHLREVSLLHAHECGEYKLVGDCHIFANDAKSTNPSWYTLQTRIPVVSEPRCKSDEESEWIGAPRLRATSYSPLLTFRHEMRLSLLCSYDLPGGEGVAKELLSFSMFKSHSAYISRLTNPPLPPC